MPVRRISKRLSRKRLSLKGGLILTRRILLDSYLELYDNIYLKIESNKSEKDMRKFLKRVKVDSLRKGVDYANGTLEADRDIADIIDLAKEGKYLQDGVLTDIPGWKPTKGIKLSILETKYVAAQIAVLEHPRNPNQIIKIIKHRKKQH